MLSTDLFRFNLSDLFQVKPSENLDLLKGVSEEENKRPEKRKKKKSGRKRGGRV